MCFIYDKYNCAQNLVQIRVLVSLLHSFTTIVATGMAEGMPFCISTNCSVN